MCVSCHWFYRRYSELSPHQLKIFFLSFTFFHLPCCSALVPSALVEPVAVGVSVYVWWGGICECVFECEGSQVNVFMCVLLFSLRQVTKKKRGGWNKKNRAEKKNQGEIREKRRVACGEGREERDCTEWVGCFHNKKVWREFKGKMLWSFSNQ